MSQNSVLSPQSSALSPQPSALCFRIFSLIFTLTITFFTPNVASADTDACKKIKFGWYFADGEHDAINALSLKLIFPSQLPQHCAALVAAFNAHPTEGSNNIYIPANNRIVTLLETRLRSDGKQGLCAIWTEFPNKPDSKCPSGYGVDQLLPDGFIPRIYPNAETCNGPLLTTEATCGDQLTLTLTPAPNQKDPRPLKAEGKDGKSTLELIATVMEGSTPKAGVAVTFGVEAIANSGGHDHHDASRPKGLVNGALTASGVTDGNGEIKVTFQAPLFAGTHTVEAICNSCSNKTVTHTLDVKVPNLTQLTGGGSGSLYKLVGDTGKHSSNHWFSDAAKDALIDLLSIFKRYGWGIVGVNDSSLIWGGCFDVSGRWGLCNNNHAGHRAGEEVDVSFYRPSGVSKDLRKKIYNDLKDSHKIGLPTILWHVDDKPNPDPTKPPLSYAHFHVYLLGQKQFNETPY